MLQLIHSVVFRISEGELYPSCLKLKHHFTYTLCLKNLSSLPCYNSDIGSTLADFGNFWQKCYGWSKQPHDALFSHLT